MLAVRALLLALFAVLGCVLAINSTHAQEPAAGTTLHPGVNLVGWVGEPAPSSQLFDEIPQLEAIWAWDAELDDWIVAGRGVPEWLGGLGRVSAGMGLRLVLGGEEPFVWERSTEPTRGLVELRTGWNLVGWSGADGAPLEQVAKGIGWSLRELRRWDAANQRWEVWTSPERSAQLIATDQAAPDEEAEPVTVRRGEALWINVVRAVNWLQPTDILPRLVFPGGASDELKARVREDLEAVLAFFGQQYGIQADPDFTVYVAKDVEALIQTYSEIDDAWAARIRAFFDDAWAARVRAWWNRANDGWGGREIVVQQARWSEDLSSPGISRARYTLTHQYFHTLHEQLSDGQASQWLAEGTTNWAQSDHRAFDGSVTWEDARTGSLREITEGTPSLRSTELSNDGWEDKLGWLAVDRLTGEADVGLYIEFWRQLTSAAIGPHGRWASTPDWRTAFQETFGISVSDFYANFDAWQQEQSAASEAAASPGDDDTRRIRGRITDESGAPVAGVFVNAIRVEGSIDVGWNQRAETDADGAFAVRAPVSGDYRISVSIADNCTRYYDDGELTEGQDETQLLTVAGSDLQGVNIRLPSSLCGRQIRGQVVSVSGEPLAGVYVIACSTGAGTCAWGATTLNGSFAVSPPAVGEYHLRLDLADSCTVYYRSSGGLTLDWSDATPVRIADSDVTNLRLQVPSDLCRQRVGGSIEGIERFLAPGRFVSVSLCRIVGTVGTGCRLWTSRNIDRDGSFAVAVPTVGSYRLSYYLNNCHLHHSPTGLTDNVAEAVLFEAGGRDLRIDHRRVPDTMCAHQISGTIVGADGAPLTGAQVTACEQVNGQCASHTHHWTENDGSFAITVPVDGSYRLSIYLDGCTAYFSQGSLTGNSDDAWLARVSGRDVQLSQRQVPAGLCGQQVSGRLVNAAGDPLAQVYVSICQLAGNDCATWVGRSTGTDGTFAVTIPGAGAYQLSINLNGCRIYYRAGSFTTREADASRINITEADNPTLQLRVPEGMCAHQISGRLLDADGEPLAQVYVSICPGDDCTTWVGQPTDADGSFARAVPATGAYLLSVDLSGCRVYYGAGGLTTREADASRIHVTESDSPNLQLRVPEGMCAHQIMGSVTKADGQPLVNTYVYACREVDGQCGDRVWSPTSADGSFAITVPADGRYRVSIALDSCWIYFRRGGFTTSDDERSIARVAGRDVRLSPRQIPEDMCTHQIMGSIIKANGQPLADTYISACREIDGRCVEGTGSHTDTDGSFAITVPADGRYRVSFGLDSCVIYFRRDGFTTSVDEHSIARVAGRDVRLSQRQIPESMCAHRISGRFVDADGAPLDERWISVYSSDRSSSEGRTDANGRFEIRVPSDDAYHFGIELRLEPYCWHEFEGQTLGGRDNPVRVSGADVTGVELRPPGTVEELCG